MKTSSKGISRRQRAAVVLLTIAACLLILEAGLRLSGRQPSNMADGISAQNGDSFRLRPNIKKTINYPAFSYTVYTDEYGFRNSSSGKRPLANKEFYAFLGASDVFGNGVEYEDSFVGILSKHAQQKDIDVLNLAVGGHYFLDQENMLRDFIKTTNLKPSLIAFCVNELHIPKFDKVNNNIIVKGGYVFNKTSWRAAYIRLMIGNLSAAYCFFRDGVRRIQEKWLGYELNDKSPEFLQMYAKKSRMHDPGNVNKFEEYLNAFEIYCEENDMKLVYIYIPISDNFRLDKILLQIGENPDDYDSSYYENIMKSYCEKKNIKLINLRPVLRPYYDSGEDLRFKLDPHYNGLGNRIIGDYLVKEMF
ncbi:MAG: hypothetical protein E4H40_04325 [Candidatus Brocadiia bacterium]|nr:MAG: hypothetical protein E4H40_04325 [Candidatus Brocadiia bacterium]